ncbi:MAG: hypothetical protein ABIR47_01895 [Candidatus Kapaibacterium sp.]
MTGHNATTDTELELAGDLFPGKTDPAEYLSASSASWPCSCATEIIRGEYRVDVMKMAVERLIIDKSRDGFRRKKFDEDVGITEGRLNCRSERADHRGDGELP